MVNVPQAPVILPRHSGVAVEVVLLEVRFEVGERATKVFVGAFLVGGRSAVSDGAKVSPNGGSYCVSQPKNKLLSSCLPGYKHRIVFLANSAVTSSRTVLTKTATATFSTSVILLSPMGTTGSLRSSLGVRTCGSCGTGSVLWCDYL
uniref:Uncharacterized protein n=1 Tax=Chromera velia CCMP2878 TaxID=1169474 RepID=A0A0G4F0S2_9ALVE|eukprot:Cvel_14624.t1-p1 / transcript=Cvel_14624.t1 / gene=Cvel_14624 / organism=Chromera_velia_CCMP2878 / gene_product=hypothetical protein / transcript_product=hypothetical protein / location=Cvel_scaffold1046:25323-26135(-) / protein_length=146 / sequence_SO=supercontig / SO=protein_coding / is_pseudo=false